MMEIEALLHHYEVFWWIRDCSRVLIVGGEFDLMGTDICDREPGRTDPRLRIVKHGLCLPYSHSKLCLRLQNP